MIYAFLTKEVNHASVLYEVPNQEGDERRQGHNNEEWQTGNSGCMSRVWDQDVQDRQERRSVLKLNGVVGTNPRPIYYTHCTFQASVTSIA